MIETGHELTVMVDECEQTANIDLAYGIKHGMVDRLAALGILERPACAPNAALDLEMRIFASVNALIDGDNPFLQLFLKVGQVLLDVLQQDRPPDAGKQ